MTAQELEQTPLFSRVSVAFGSETFQGYIVKKINNLCFVYSPDRYILLGNLYPIYLTLISLYQPKQIAQPPYDLNTLPLFSTVRVSYGSFVKDGIAIDKSTYTGEVNVFFSDNSQMWILDELVTFLSPPPGATYVYTAPKYEPEPVPEPPVYYEPEPVPEPPRYEPEPVPKPQPEEETEIEQEEKTVKVESKYLVYGLCGLLLIGLFWK
jgi:hypothetical protein